MDYLLKASIVIILFYLCFLLFLKKETFFQHNRGFLLAGIIIALVFPLIVIPIYIPIETVILTDFEHINTNTPVITSQAPNLSLHWTDFIPFIYAIGFIVFLIQFAFQFGSLIMLVLKNPRVKDGIYTYVTVKYNISPFSFFKWIVYNPNAFQDNELELILTHEKVHASQFHSIDILMTQLACVIFWFNPLMWLYRKAIRQNLEYIADFKTQKTCDRDIIYQHLLLKTSVKNHQIPLSNNFYNSLIKERIVMLKKSRSNQKKLWRYLLILPLLAILLMSVNTKEVYIEETSNTKKADNTIEFIVTKNTTDSELKSMSKSVEAKGGSLAFSDLKRNKDNEITNIFVKLYNHSYGGSNSNKPIESFIIYKELSGLEGGFVGRLGNGTTHFGANDLNNVLVDENKNLLRAFENRLQSTIIKHGLYNSEDKKRFDDSESIEIIITKDTSNDDLEDIKKELQNHGITFTYKVVKRNSKGEIIAINTTFKNAKNATKYNILEEDGIESFHFKSSDETFSVGTLNKNTRTQTSNNTNKVIIIEENDDDSNDSTVDIKKLKNEDSVYFIRKNNKFTFSTGDNEDSDVIFHESDEPIFIINGKKVEKTIFEDVDSEDIESVFVLKGKKAVEKFGNEGKNGAIVMTKRGSRALFSESEDEVVLNSKNSFKFETDGDQPLIILDGKIINEGDLDNVNPNQIDNVEVLKDKSATKLYGKKGENGVIVINTKKKGIQNSNNKGILIEKEDGSPYQIEVSNVYAAYDDEEIATEFIITKNSSDASLEQLKEKLKEHGIDAKFSKVKRNNAGEITSIKISLDDNDGRKSSASWKEKNQAIPDIFLGKSNDDKLYIRAI